MVLASGEPGRAVTTEIEVVAPVPKPNVVLAVAASAIS